MLEFDKAKIEMGDRVLMADFALPKDGRIAVLGPSGAGKSTLLNAVAGFVNMQGGALHWKGGRLDSLPPEQRPVSILFQDSNLFPHLDIRRNLGLALQPNGRRLKTGQIDQVSGALERVGLAGLEHRKPGDLSGGQQGRAALARVLLQERPILLLDEPFAALGPALKQEMLDLVRVVADQLGALVMMVTHDAEDAKRFAEAVVLVADGVAAAPVETQALFADPPPALRAYLG